jgi:hypothetical protein
MSRAATAGLIYFSIVFVFGFLAGAIREIYVVGHLGPVVSRLVEAPLMLGLSWGVASWLVGRFNVASRAGPRLAMGGLALMLLLAAECVLGVYGFGQTLRGHMGEYLSAKGLAGLLVQVPFGFIPWLLPWRQDAAHV